VTPPVAAAQPDERHCRSRGSDEGARLRNAIGVRGFHTAAGSVGSMRSVEAVGPVAFVTLRPVCSSGITPTVAWRP
jgi:hypothetical protein